MPSIDAALLAQTCNQAYLRRWLISRSVNGWMIAPTYIVTSQPSDSVFLIEWKTTFDSLTSLMCCSRFQGSACSVVFNQESNIFEFAQICRGLALGLHMRIETLDPEKVHIGNRVTVQRTSIKLSMNPASWLKDVESHLENNASKIYGSNFKC